MALEAADDPSGDDGEPSASQPPEASQPSDASQPPDATEPPDASRSPDAAEPPEESPSSAVEFTVEPAGDDAWKRPWESPPDQGSDAPPPGDAPDRVRQPDERLPSRPDAATGALWHEDFHEAVGGAAGAMIDAADAVDDEAPRTTTGQPVGDEVHPAENQRPELEADLATSAVLAVVAVLHRLKTLADKHD
ncbi:hypothetical protein AB0K14_06815 [Actinosynnema sp. NPDC050801]|uniref:hypothetical protein n=1 Tax=unclassified Actinosynnema TaxID=2637065 RepID=UPI0033DDBB4B